VRKKKGNSILPDFRGKKRPNGKIRGQQGMGKKKKKNAGTSVTTRWGRRRLRFLEENNHLVTSCKEKIRKTRRGGGEKSPN